MSSANDMMIASEIVLIVLIAAAILEFIITIWIIYSIISANKHLEHIEEFCDWYYKKHKDSEQISVASGSDSLKQA